MMEVCEREKLLVEEVFYFDAFGLSMMVACVSDIKLWCLCDVIALLVCDVCVMFGVIVWCL